MKYIDQLLAQDPTLTLESTSEHGQHVWFINSNFGTAEDAQGNQLNAWAGSSSIALEMLDAKVKAMLEA